MGGFGWYVAFGEPSIRFSEAILVFFTFEFVLVRPVGGVIDWSSFFVFLVGRRGRK